MTKGKTRRVWLGSNGQRYFLVFVKDASTGKPLRPESFFLAPEDALLDNDTVDTSRLIRLGQVPEIIPHVDEFIRSGDIVNDSSVLVAEIQRL